MNREVFFNAVRKAPFGGSLTPGQVDGMNRILNEWERRGRFDIRWLAYLLATTKWETAHKMQPVREGGGEAYLRSKKYYPWVGEGLVQCTWETNHRKFGATAPGQMMTWPIALRALFDGCIKGMFTGKKLSDYFNATTDDPVNARRIVNGTDKAAQIAAIHRQFLTALKAALVASIAPTKPAEPKKPAVTKSTATGTAGGVFATGTIATGIQQGWSLMEWSLVVAAIFLVAVVGYFGWRWYQNRKWESRAADRQIADEIEGYEVEVAMTLQPPAWPVGIASPPLTPAKRKASPRATPARKTAKRKRA